MNRRILPLLAPLASMAVFLYVRAHAAYALDSGDLAVLFRSLARLGGERLAGGTWLMMPLEWIGCLALVLRHIFEGTEPTIALDLFRTPLAYLQWHAFLTFAVLLTGQWFAGWILLRRRVSPSLALSAQLLPFVVWLAASGTIAHIRTGVAGEGLEELLTRKYSACHVTLLGPVPAPAFALYEASRSDPREPFAPDLRDIFSNYSFRDLNEEHFHVFGSPLADSQWARRAFSTPCRIVVGSGEESLRAFAKIFGAPPQIQEELGPDHSVHVMALPPDVVASFQKFLPKR